jgi:hypothetical protein
MTTAPTRTPAMAHQPAASRTWFHRAREVASDLLIVTALLWTLPLLLGAAAAVARFLAGG